VKDIAGRSVIVIERDRPTARQIDACLTAVGLSVLGPVATIREGMELLASHPVHAIVVELDTPTGDGRADELASAAAARTIPVVYVSARSDIAALRQAVDRGGDAYVLEPFADRQLVASVAVAMMRAERAVAEAAPAALTSDEKLRAIAALINGEPPNGARMRARSRQAGEPIDSLSAREREIVELLANGARVITIAQRLELSPHTVRNHLKSAFRKLKLRGQHELFEYWRARA
jgi:DNA-binding NarL/FixJ family response regulator